MSDVKSTLSVLCDLLKVTYNFEMQPEAFKSAKYNKNNHNCVEQFWSLLNLFCDKYLEDIIDNTKIYFASQYYQNLEFYSLQKDLNYGSRELLIAFAWLMSKNNILDNKMKDIILKSEISREFDVPQLTKQNYQIDTNFKTIIEYQNRILSLCGKINLNLKMIEEYNEKTVQLLDKIHTVAPNLSVLEINHLKHQNLDKYLQEIKSISNLLDLYSKWRKNEKCFWQWMLTVIELKNNKIDEMVIDTDTLKLFIYRLHNYIKDTSNVLWKKMTTTFNNQYPRGLGNSEKNPKKYLADMDYYHNSLQSEEMENLKLIKEFIRNAM